MTQGQNQEKNIAFTRFCKLWEHGPRVTARDVIWSSTRTSVIGLANLITYNEIVTAERQHNAKYLVLELCVRYSQCLLLTLDLRQYGFGTLKGGILFFDGVFQVGDELCQHMLSMEVVNIIT